MSELLQQGIIQVKQGDYQTAIATFDRAIAANLTEPIAYYQRGLAYYKLGQVERAKQTALMRQRPEETLSR